MAKILNKTTMLEIELLPLHIFGRQAESVNTLLKDMEISRLHAQMGWDGDSWFIQDGSTNGTFINNQIITKSVKYKLNKGDQIHFGSLNSDQWILIDSQAPNSMLAPISDSLDPIILKNFHVIPDEEKPEVTLFLSTQGHWLCETQKGTFDLKNGDTVGVPGKLWKFFDANPTVETKILPKDQTPKKIEFTFKASQNEEHVSLSVQLDSSTFDLGHRNHHYMALLLARKKNQDQQEGITPMEQGWIDKDLFCKMLGLSEHHLNIQIYRLRKQVNDALGKIPQANNLIERRNGEIRIGVDQVNIIGGFSQENLATV